jgi:hypothetical protein
MFTTCIPSLHLPFTMSFLETCEFMMIFIFCWIGCQSLLGFREATKVKTLSTIEKYNQRHAPFKRWECFGLQGKSWLTIN